MLIGALEALSAVAARVPRRQALPLCRVAGRMWFIAAPSAREAVRDNLRHVLGREPPRHMVRRVFEFGVLNYWDTLGLVRVEPRAILELVELRGLEHVRAARANGHGVILASAHLGSISLVGQVMPAVGYPLVGLLEPIRPPELFEFFSARREALGNRMLAATPAVVRELLAALRRNEILGLITDRDMTGGGPIISFFGAPTHFPDGAAALSVRTGAPILPAIAVVQPDGGFVAVIEPPVSLPRTGDTRADVLALTQAVAGRLEYHIASHPEQWTVFQKRWPDARPR